jgi:hypothetical protein
VLRAFAARNLPSHLDPGREVVIPCDVGLGALHLAGADLGRALGTNENASSRGRGFGEAGQNFDSQSTSRQGMDAVETPLVEIDGGTTAIDPDRFLGEGKLGDLEDDRPIGKEDDGTLGIGVTTAGNSIDAQGRVLVEPQDVGIGKNDFHPRFSGGIHAVASHQRHIDDRFQALFSAGRLHGCVAFEIRDVAQ